MQTPSVRNGTAEPASLLRRLRRTTTCTPAPPDARTFPQRIARSSNGSERSGGHVVRQALTAVNTPLLLRLAVAHTPGAKPSRSVVSSPSPMREAAYVPYAPHVPPTSHAALLARRLAGEYDKISELKADLKELTEKIAAEEAIVEQKKNAFIAGLWKNSARLRTPHAAAGLFLP